MMDRLFNSIRDAMASMLGANFTSTVTTTNQVPTINDSALTFVDAEQRTHASKLIESCVLYIDIRDSTKLNLTFANYKEDLSRLYAFFVRSMVEVSQFYGGHIRNIIGDRVMVVFDVNDCYYKAVLTAALMQTVASRIISPITENIANFKFRCGVGIDYGEMMVSKVGEARRGDNRESYRSLVWLGPPANVASKLTDLAYKMEIAQEPRIRLTAGDGIFTQIRQSDTKLSDLLQKLSIDISAQIGEVFTMNQISPKTGPRSFPPILITERVYRGFSARAPVHNSVTEQMWRQITMPETLQGISVWGADIYLKGIDIYYGVLN